MDVIIAGAGIAGLAAAISLRRSGHHVTLYERSSLNNEIGAAINVPANVTRFLVPWGLDPVRAMFVRGKGTHFCDHKTLETYHKVDLVALCEEAGAPLFYAHRVALHEELKRLACGAEGVGVPAKVVVRAEVKTYVSILILAQALRSGFHRRVQSAHCYRIPLRRPSHLQTGPSSLPTWS